MQIKSVNASFPSVNSYRKEVELFHRPKHVIDGLFFLTPKRMLSFAMTYNIKW